MDGLESFLGMDKDEPMSEAAFEAFKQKMQGSGQDLTAWAKGEQRQKAKEDELLKILLKYIKRHDKTSFVLLISRLLEQNVPAGFILAIILLGDKEVQDDLNIKLALPGEVTTENNTSNLEENTTMLALFGIQDHTMPLKARIEFDYWTKNLLEQASLVPHRIIKTLEEKDENGIPNGKPKLISIQLMSFVLREFLSRFQIASEFESVQHFALFVLAGIIKQTHKQVDEQNLLNE